MKSKSVRNFFSGKHVFINITVFLALSLLFNACNKNNDDADGGGNYYMKFTINGITKEYKGNTLAQFTSPGYEASMTALEDPLSSDNSMSLVVHSDIAFATNITYTETNNSTGYPAASLVYFDELGNVYSSLNTTLAPDTKATIQFTEITNTYVRGTFSGKLYDDAFSSADYTVANGSFYLKRE